MAKAGRKKYSVGSIVAILLPDGRYAFAKAFNEPDFGIYDLISDKIEPVDVVIRHPFVFYQASTDKAIKSGEWPVIGEQPFATEEEAWAPPKAIYYLRETQEWTMGGIPRIDHKGKVRIATLEEVTGLDIVSVCSRPEGMVRLIVDRLINGNNDKYKVI